MVHVLYCDCPGCKSAIPLSSLDSSTCLACTACGRNFNVREAMQPQPETSPEPLQPAVAPGAASRPRRGRLALALGLAVVSLLAVMAWILRPDVAAEFDAIRAFCAPLAATDSGYPRAAQSIRRRAWLAGSLSQPDGVAVFTRMASPDFGRAIVLDGGRLHDLLGPLRGLSFLPRLGAWVETARSDEIERNNLTLAEVTARGIRHVARDELSQRLESGLGDATATRAILDLLAGRAAEGAPDLGRRMLAEGEFPDAIVIRPFSGAAGECLIDQHRPPYLIMASPYQGLLLRCVGAGWTPGYRILTLDKEEGQSP